MAYSFCTNGIRHLNRLSSCISQNISYGTLYNLLIRPRCKNRAERASRRRSAPVPQGQFQSQRRIHL
ncbi:hypothetical protein EFD55_12675 [Rhizobium pisi]|uniref:Uncharacterized protein n=1 Tax=Rhizobium pisi TaxID=574561 RepID=A0A3R9HHV6_9HYPH|nr:hypothetical protein EFD55_12675 [Rhizobium pisi]TCA59563.1 hypothetical protein E0J16_10610 [Rhizobium pisi]